MRSFLLLSTLSSLFFLPFTAQSHETEAHVEFSPAFADFQGGQEFSLAVILATVEPATSFRIHIPYDGDALEVKQIEKNDEDFLFWWMQEAKNGVIELEASTPAPGFSGEAVVATITLEGIEAGSAEFMLAASSLVLNGEDENMLGSEEEVPPSTVSAPESTEVEAAQASPEPQNTGLVAVGLLAAGAVGAGILFLLRRVNAK